MALLDFSTTACIVLIVVVVIILLVFVLALKFVIEFFPSVIIAGLVWYFTNDFFYTLVAFLATAVIFALIGRARRQNRPIA